MMPLYVTDPALNGLQGEVIILKIWVNVSSAFKCVQQELLWLQDDAIPKQLAWFPLEHTCKKSSCWYSRLFTEITKTEPLKSPREVPVALTFEWPDSTQKTSEIHVLQTAFRGYHSAPRPWSHFPHSMIYYGKKLLQLTNPVSTLPLDDTISPPSNWKQKCIFQKENDSKVYQPSLPTRIPS